MSSIGRNTIILWTSKKKGVTSVKNGRARVSKNSCLRNSNDTISKNCQKQFFPELWKLTKGLQQSGKCLFKVKQNSIPESQYEHMNSELYGILTFPFLPGPPQLCGSLSTASVVETNSLKAIRRAGQVGACSKPLSRIIVII